LVTVEVSETDETAASCSCFHGFQGQNFWTMKTPAGVLAASGQRDTHSIPLLVEWQSLCYTGCNALPSVLPNSAWLHHDGYMYGDGAVTHYRCWNSLCSSECFFQKDESHHLRICLIFSTQIQSK